jgi:D-alanyl-D-alanine carboxypeptidase/D-alanyl-D-alanine-endopeptidase (penicillin-binding protein 4)
MGVRRSNAHVLLVVAFAALTILAAAAVARSLPPIESWFGEGDANDVATARVARAAAPAPPAPPALNVVLEEPIEQLRQMSLYPSDSGIYAAAVDGAPLVSLNDERLYNSASLTKLITSLVALDKFPAEHSFKTIVLVGGVVTDGVVDGDLMIRADGDPTLDAAAMRSIATALADQGIKRVTGGLVVAGPFTYRSYDETHTAAERFLGALRGTGIRIDGNARTASAVDGIGLVMLESRPLSEILERVNAHSINWIADNLATTLGGPAAVKERLVEVIGIAPGEVVVTNGSGLDNNRITPRGMVATVRALLETADRRGIAHDRILPIAGVDDSTVRTRFQDEDYRGAVIAKTGTQSNVDGGVATLAGVAYTRDRGAVVFAILNSNGDVHTYRKWEDDVLKSIIDASGGPAPLPRSENAVPSNADHALTTIGRAEVTTKAAAPARR